VQDGLSGDPSFTTLGTLTYEPQQGTQDVERRQPLKADVNTFEDLMKIVSSEGIIQFLRDHSFGNAYRRDFMDPLYEFMNLRGGPEHEFIDPELERMRRELRADIQTFLSLLHKNTFHQREIAGEHPFYRIPDEWERTQGHRYLGAIKSMNSAADLVCGGYDNLVRTARAKLLS
jgi:hypothetical protein